MAVGSNDNSNASLQLYLNENGNTSLHDQAELDQVADWLNDQPRVVLDGELQSRF